MTKISSATATTPPLNTDLIPFARVGDTVARHITVGNFLANAPATTFINAHTFAAGLLSLGNVGIGTTAPGVNGGNVDIRFATSAIDRGVNTPAQLFVSDNATSQAADAGGRIDLGGWSAGLSKPYTWGGIKGAAEAVTGNKGYLAFFTQAASSTLMERIRIDGSGNVGIGTTAPKSALHVIGLPIHANNAAAIAGGLTAGAFFRTNADPDTVCVVH